MSELDQTNISKIRSTTKSAVDLLAEPITVRVSPHSYLIVVLLGTFFSALLFYLEIDTAGYALFVLSWIIVPFLGLRDRISFDGRSLTRTGVLPRFWTWFNGSRRRLKLTDIEQVETHAVRTLKRGGNIYYRYRTVFRGKGLSVTIASGGESFRRMVAAILPQLPQNSLDVRSEELRTYLKDPKETLMKAEFARIPSAALAATSIRERHRPPEAAAPIDNEETHEIRLLANELRASGYLAQAVEAFRRALRRTPKDGRLLFEFARCIHSFAAVERNADLERRSLAALRLAERRGENDADLLVRLGEFYFELGEWRRAGRIFQRILDRLGDNFRAARGMAEMALHEGKIADVVHHFAAADRVAETPALRRWARGEADYFSHLNSDDEYMEMEVSRVNLLDGLERSKRTALRIASLAFPAVIVGLVFEDDLIANVGWAVSTVSLVIWAGLTVGARMFSQRIPYDLIDTDDR